MSGKKPHENPPAFLKTSVTRQVRFADRMLAMRSALVHDDTFRRLCRARDLLAAEYQSQILLDAAAREACLSPFHFHRLFRSTFGETPHDFLTRRRMDRARHLLASGEMTVTEVCLEVGYSSLGSFSAKFQSLAGRTPTAYQREVRRIFGFQKPWKIMLVPACFFSSYGGVKH